jgi:hypothetical protein
MRTTADRPWLLTYGAAWGRHHAAMEHSTDAHEVCRAEHGIAMALVSRATRAETTDIESGMAVAEAQRLVVQAAAAHRAKVGRST